MQSYKWLLILSLSFSPQGMAATPEMTSGATTQAPLRVGLLPYLSPGELIKTWQPFVNWLEHQVQRSMVMKSATDYKTFIQRSSEGRYDILLAPPHIALLAKRRAHYRVVAGFDANVVGEVLVREDSPYQRIEELRGLDISAPASTALISMLGEALLLKHGFKPQTNVRMHYTGSHNNAILALANGKVDAAFALSGLYGRMAATVPVKLRSLGNTAAALPALVLTHPALNEADNLRISEAVLRAAKDPALKGFFQQLGMGTPRVLTRNELQAFEPMITMLLGREEK
jgi:phosphonate transport system substrate-binding protein